MLGTDFVPAFRTTIARLEDLASFWLAGNVAFSTATGKLPRGSFTSCFCSPPHPATSTVIPARAVSAPAPILRCALLTRKSPGTLQGVVPGQRRFLVVRKSRNVVLFGARGRSRRAGLQGGKGKWFAQPQTGSSCPPRISWSRWGT